MREIFLHTLSQTTVLFVFLLIGYFLRWRKILPDNTARVLSKLEMTVILPMMNFKSFSTNFTRETIREAGVTLISGAALLGVVFGLALLLAFVFAKERNERDIYIYSFTIPNFGYMGYALMLALYGDVMMFNMQVFCLPMSMFVYSLGMYLLSPQKKWNLRSFFNPSFISMLVGMLYGVSGLPRLNLVLNICTSGANCMAPLAMILTGFVIASRPPITLLKDIKVYIACAIRLLGLPGAALLLCSLLGVPALYRTLIVVFLAMPMGLNTIVFPEAAGGDSSTGAKMALISNVAGLVTIPLMLSLL